MEMVDEKKMMIVIDEKIMMNEGDGDV